MEGLEATFKIVTPLFLAGANQGEAELREPSVKGALRYWYRAVDPEYSKNEAGLFGGTRAGEGQSKFLLRVVAQTQNFDRWQKAKYIPLTRNGKNGVLYFGYSLDMNRRERDNYQPRAFLRAGSTFKLQLVFRKRRGDKNGESLVTPEDRRRLLSSLWLLGHIGGLGYRARRGFGTVALQSWRWLNSQWPELGELPIAHGASTSEEWRNKFERGLRVIQQWFPRPTASSDHLALDQQTTFLLWRNGFGRERQFEAWTLAMDSAGRLMQEFRLRYKNSGGRYTSDYAEVKAHLVAIDKMAAEADPRIKPNRMSRAPLRAAFGLPLAFRFSSLGGRSLTFEGLDPKMRRSASRVWVRVIEIGSRCHPFYAFFFGAPLLPRGVLVGYGRGRNGLAQPPDTALMEFKNIVQQYSLPEVRL